MSDNMLTTKELALMADLLTAEENLCKKVRLYSRIMTNPKVAEELKAVADCHERRFNALYEMI